MLKHAFKQPNKKVVSLDLPIYFEGLAGNMEALEKTWIIIES